MPMLHCDKCKDHNEETGIVRLGSEYCENFRAGSGCEEGDDWKLKGDHPEAEQPAAVALPPDHVPIHTDAWELYQSARDEVMMIHGLITGAAIEGVPEEASASERVNVLLKIMKQWNAPRFGSVPAVASVHGGTPSIAKAEHEEGDGTTNITSCARCGGDHEGVILHRFARPCGAFTHYAACPQLGQPILVTVQPCEAGRQIITEAQNTVQLIRRDDAPGAGDDYPVEDDG